MKRQSYNKPDPELEKEINILYNNVYSWKSFFRLGLLIILAAFAVGCLIRLSTLFIKAYLAIHQSAPNPIMIVPAPASESLKLELVPLPRAVESVQINDPTFPNFHCLKYRGEGKTLCL